MQHKQHFIQVQWTSIMYKEKFPNQEDVPGILYIFIIIPRGNILCDRDFQEDQYNASQCSNKKGKYLTLLDIYWILTSAAQ